MMEITPSLISSSDCQALFKPHNIEVAMLGLVFLVLCFRLLWVTLVEFGVLLFSLIRIAFDSCLLYSMFVSGCSLRSLYIWMLNF
ncbi:hypothetical protein RHGRI_023356 [Rhododendron griersonianum]|uniref:Uncharacterized protein n=1 Tax=Rhododendron griersonianum TaxID=479676 RepID=A0AAV6J7R2_9ERIC|nr:hypothetical protein RHGRI_023356 [Rhododendron griersonianum]